MPDPFALSAQNLTAFMRWNTGFAEQLHNAQVMDPSQWRLFDGTNELIMTTATVSVGNFASGDWVLGPLDPRPRQITFVNTKNDFKLIGGEQVPDYSIDLVPFP